MGGVTTVFVNLPNTKLELLHPFGEKSPIANFLEKNKKGGIHHICIEVDNIHEAMKSCAASGVRLLNKEPKIGAHGKPVVFLHQLTVMAFLLSSKKLNFKNNINKNII